LRRRTPIIHYQVSRAGEIAAREEKMDVRREEKRGCQHDGQRQGEVVGKQHLRETIACLLVHWCSAVAVIVPFIAARFVLTGMSTKLNPEQRLWRIAGEQAEAEMISRYLAGGEPIDADFDEDQLWRYEALTVGRAITKGRRKSPLEPMASTPSDAVGDDAAETA
jgi:hypothetical protein